MRLLLGLLFFSLFTALPAQSLKEVVPEAGMIITESVRFKAGLYRFPGADSLDRPILIIQGNDVVVDFNGAVFQGADKDEKPDAYTGLGVLVQKGRNIQLKNAAIHGYRVGIMAKEVDRLKIIDADLSHNYRQRLKSKREREDLSDWLSYHRNEADEWLRYGAAVYLKKCDSAQVKNLRVVEGQNGLMLVDCHRGLFYNNTIQFNSGVGIGLYRSTENRVLHNRLDWNVRGYSHGFYRRGQDSAGILVYEQSSKNIFAYNSATHSGDGFFLWAGESTMNSGEGGCNDNLIYGNDFSHAPTNGIEVTFSRNKLVNNRLEECTYGIWAGYSYETLILGNQIRRNDYGIAIEHGQENTIDGNLFEWDTIGIKLWERDRQPSDWGYSENRDVSSRNYTIRKNWFKWVRIPLQLEETKQLIIDQGNQFYRFNNLWSGRDNEDVTFYGNFIHENRNWGEAEPFRNQNALSYNSRSLNWKLPKSARDMAPESPADAFDAMLPESHPRGRKFIFVDEWGPYSFQYPLIQLKKIEKDQYIFEVLGPPGQWSLVGQKGWKSVSSEKGALPVTITAVRSDSENLLQLELEYIGQRFFTRFGQEISAGTPYRFQFERFEKKLDWVVQFHNIPDAIDPLSDESGFSKLKNEVPVATDTLSELAYNWWGAPTEGVDQDRFATFASTSFDIKPGKYRIQVTSDDGLRLYLDGERLIDNWNIHVPETDEIVVELGGQHRIDIEHFEGGGFATLSFYLTPER
jgi:parallel beta-helix repeat protein